MERAGHSAGERLSSGQSWDPGALDCCHSLLPGSCPSWAFPLPYSLTVYFFLSNIFLEVFAIGRDSSSYTNGSQFRVL